MSTYNGVVTVSRIAGSSLSPYRFVTMATGDSKYDHSGAQGRIDGICAEAGVVDTKTFPMVIPNGAIVKVEAGAAVALTDEIASDASGRAIPAVSGAGNWTAGRPLTTAAAAGEIIEIQFIVDRDQA